MLSIPSTQCKNFNILLVEDNPTDVILLQEALKEDCMSAHLTVVETGEEALMFLRQEGSYQDRKWSDLMLLDINLPGRSGIEILREVKNDETLRRIPVIIFSNSKADSDVRQCYALHANCYIVKPIDFYQFSEVIQMIQKFWFSVVQLPDIRGLTRSK